MLRFLFSSIRSNSSNNFTMSSSFMPIPVSCTEKSNTTFLLSIRPSTLSMTFPCCVYFTALFNKLTNTCLIRTSSPNNFDGKSPSTCICNSSFFASAFAFIIFEISCIRLLKSYSTIMISSFPDSILEKSRISLIKDNKFCPAF